MLDHYPLWTPSKTTKRPVCGNLKQDNMKTKTLITRDEALRLLHYCKDTGKLFKVVDGDLKPCLRKDKDGYLSVSLKGRNYAQHRIIWFIAYGKWPTHEIDHINGIVDDNRLSNLREATPSENSRNTKLRTDNASGYKGVHWRSRESKWRARVRVKGFAIERCFHNKEDAIQFAKMHREKLHGKFCNYG